MPSILVFNHVTLDGVMQAPGRADEDTRDGFAHGGWAMPGNDEVMGRVIGSGMGHCGGLLLGRRTYDDFAAFWPKQPQPNPFTTILDNAQKYVSSRTLRDPLTWQNSTLLDGDIVDAVSRLKRGPGADLVIFGSGELIRSLMPQRLIDRFVLLIHPLVLGSGRRLFTSDGTLAAFRLVESTPTTTGVIIATYELRDRNGA